ncbi:3-hydroxybutyryl-CoA dehydrogenase [Sulfolobales archaeon HS-7]|nr:3-hydroxybutyryl-CoA dehydrogenase [Sulfolobales archaeon HS-7]
MKVGVIGSGTMGHGIAEVVAIKKHSVVLIDVDWKFLNNAKEKIYNSLTKLAQKGEIKDTPEEVMERIKLTLDYKELADAELIIEAVPEKIEIKSDVFKKVDSIINNDTILASNTSSIPISSIAEFTSRKENVIGLHFFNPPPLMKLVEVVPSKFTSEEVVRRSVNIVSELGKVPVKLRIEVPGFVSNRIFLRLLQEGCREVENGEMRVEELDSMLRHKVKLPMGIFELADYTGIDVIVDIWNVIVSGGADDVPCSLYREKIARGELGVKSGKGFYVYPAPGKFVKPELVPTSKGEPARFISLAVNEAAWLVANYIVSKDDIDTVMKLGFNFPKGLFEMGNEFGFKSIIDNLVDIYTRGYSAYKPNEYLYNLVKD